MGIRIVKTGLLSTVQDLGINGYQKDGVIVSGAMDTLALRIGNILLGNPENEAGIELTLLGGSIYFEKDQLIAITGAELSAKLDGRAVPNWKPVFAGKGTTLTFGKPIIGCRAYLTVLGGFDIAPVFNSCSTYLKAGFGGWEGRSLVAGDTIPFRKEFTGGQTKFNWSADLRSYPSLDNNTIRFIKGPHFEIFNTDEDAQSFNYTISQQADRMGYRLDGEKLIPTESIEILSAAVTFGTVQVPPDGNPIVLMADHQTTGGYPIFAQVIGADLPLLAQKKPGDKVQFEQVSLEFAQGLLIDRQTLIKQLIQTINLKYE